MPAVQDAPWRRVNQGIRDSVLREDGTSKVIKDSAERKKRIESCLEQVGLGSRAKHLPQQLSGGQQQRVAIARALAGEPRFLLADEPTGNLDSLMARQVMELLEQINRDGATIVMVTHDPELARRAPRNIQIVDGQVADLTLYQGVAGQTDRQVVGG